MIGKDGVVTMKVLHCACFRQRVDGLGSLSSVMEGYRLIDKEGRRASVSACTVTSSVHGLTQPCGFCGLTRINQGCRIGCGCIDFRLCQSFAWARLRDFNLGVFVRFDDGLGALS